MSISFSKKTSYDGTEINGGFIYENGPENIGSNLLNTAAKGRAFTAVPLTSGKIYEAEFYNWNYSNSSIYIGIGIKNTSSSAAGSVTILKSYADKGSSGIDVGPNVTLAFMKDSRSNSPITIPVNSSANTNQGFVALTYVKLSNKQIGNGRVRFKVNSGSSLQCKIFFVADGDGWEKRAGWTNIITSSDLALTDPNGGTYSTHEYRTGLYSSVGRYAVLNTTEQTFAMGKVSGNKIVDDFNSEEFETPTNTLPFANKGNMGNYGIVYSFYGSNTNAKTVTLTPVQTDKARYVVKVDGVWKIHNATKSSPAQFTLSNGTSFWFVLAGGNFGKVKVKFS